jgi:multimeric flavodoxin WrbA
MGKTLLGIVASPRRLGNCELFIKEIHSNLGAGWELRLMRLPELDIQPCRACYRCLFDSMRCPHEDDFLAALEELCAADAYAVAAPAYLLAANGSLKKFLDRGLQFYAMVDRLWGKPAVGAAVAGIAGMEGITELNVASFIKMTFGDLRGSAVVYGALPGEVLLNPENRQTAAGLARALCDPGSAMKPRGPVCPLCGGDTFRFDADGGIKCMLCSSAGRYGWDEGRLSIEIAAGDHPLFLSRGDVVRHAEWLRGMKDKFLEKKKELKAVVKEHIGTGTWVGKKGQGGA